MTDPSPSNGNVIAGARWVAISEALRQVIRIVVALFVARWLGPAEYGLAAIAIIVNMFLETARDLGTGEAIVQAKEIGNEQLSTLFWLNVVVGSLLFGCAFALAPLIAELFNQPAAVGLVRVASAAILCAGVGIVPRAVLRRRLEFRAIAAITLFSSAVNSVAVLVFASQGAGAWSIAYGTLITAAVTSTVLLFVSKWRPLIMFDWKHVSQVAKFSLNLSAYRLVQFLTAHGDKVIVGAAYSPADLGNYNLANRVIRNPMSVTQTSFTNVLFPVMSKYQDDDRRVGDTYLRGVGVVAVLIFPLVALVVALGHPLVNFVLGEKWLSAVPLIGVIAIVGAIESVTTTAGTLFRVKGRTDLLFRFGLIASPITMLCYWMGAKVSVMGVAWGYLAAMALLFYPLFHLSLGLIGMRVSALIERLLPVVLVAAASGGAAYGARRVIESSGSGDLVVLVVASLVAGFVYLVLASLTKLRAIEDLFSNLIPQQIVVGPFKRFVRETDEGL